MWARANGCEWDAQTCAEAAGGGYLEVTFPPLFPFYDFEHAQYET